MSHVIDAFEDVINHCSIVRNQFKSICYEVICFLKRAQKCFNLICLLISQLVREGVEMWMQSFKAPYCLL